MQIVELRASNFKRLRAVEIRPDGPVVEIRGRNGAGKSSILDAIWCALGGADVAPSRPIREGADRAEITLDLGDLVVTRRFLPSGNSPLVVAQHNGARFPSPQAVLDKLIGAIAFDPLEFTRMRPKDQLEALRQFVALDVDLDELATRRAAHYAKRTDVNRQAQALRGKAAGIEIAPDLPAQPIDTDALMAEVARAGESNAGIERERARRAGMAQQVDRQRMDALKLRARRKALLQEARKLWGDIRDLEADRTALVEQIAALPPLLEPTDTATLAAEIGAAQRINAAIAERARRAEIEAEAERIEAESRGLTTDIECLDRQKAEAIGRAQFPVDGLGFGDGEVLYRGLPFDQASQAEKIRVSVGIAMASNPNLRVLCVRDGSLLDDDSTHILSELVADNGYQLWLERVGDADAATGILIEDGAVVGAPQVEGVAA
jgi:hypothetical protein